MALISKNLYDETQSLSGERLREWRVNRNLSQQDLASGIGVGISTVQRWESGETTPAERYRPILKQLLQSPLTDHSATEALSGKQRWLKEMPHLLDVHIPERDAVRVSEGQVMPPYPEAEEEKAKVRMGTLTVGIDQVLLDRFSEEASVRGLTHSKLLESILWHRFSRPKLSFQAPCAKSVDCKQETLLRTKGESELEDVRSSEKSVER